jgi:hypothetical protein
LFPLSSVFTEKNHRRIPAREGGPLRGPM